MYPDLEELLLENPSDDVLLIRLNRPLNANAINTKMGSELADVFSKVASSEKAPRCILLASAGKHFCAGGDLKERNGMTDKEFFEQHRIFERMILSIIDCPIPTMAVVNGIAYGGGCELALACDFIYASYNAKLALTETSLGIIPGCGGTQNLPRAIGMRRAKEAIFSANPITAEQAFNWGLVNHICEPESLEETALTLARRISQNAPLAVRQAKRAVDYGARMDLRTAMHFEIDAYNYLVTTRDRREGISAFREKRRPLFNGT